MLARNILSALRCGYSGDQPVPLVRDHGYLAGYLVDSILGCAAGIHGITHQCIRATPIGVCYQRKYKYIHKYILGVR